MRIPLLVLSGLLCAGFLALSIPKLTGQRQMVDRMAHIGVSAKQARILGILEIAAAAGILLGLIWAPIGVAAAVGVVIQMIGAMVFHARAKDPLAVVSAPLSFALLAAAIAVLHIVDA